MYKIYIVNHRTYVTIICMVIIVKTILHQLSSVLEVGQIFLSAVREVWRG